LRRYLSSSSAAWPGDSGPSTVGGVRSASAPVSSRIRRSAEPDGPASSRGRGRYGWAPRTPTRGLALAVVWVGTDSPGERIDFGIEPGPAECRHDHRHAPSPPPEHDAVTAVGISPGDGPLTVAHLIARAALETLLVVEQDAAVGGGNEQRGRACVHTVLGRAGAADIGVHGDMRPFPDPELHRGHPLIERHCRVTHRFRSLIGMPASPASRRGPDPAAGPY